MSRRPTTPFKKPWLSFADQVKLLQQRDLVVADVPAAEQFLAHLSYYRFSGYCLAFESQRHAFVTGTTFEQVVEAYNFDLILRDLITEALEVIEVDLRANVAYSFGKRYGPFGHVDASNFFYRFQHQEWLERLQEEARRSSELFVTHFRNAYDEFPNLPIWIATEVMSFGGLSRMFSGMDKADQKPVAQRYRLQPRVLATWMHHMVYVRNLCAHHSRLWDRVWAIKPELPAGKAWRPPHLPGNNRLFATLLLLRHLMKHVPAIVHLASQWQSRVTDHLRSPPATSNPLGRMGLTTNWNQHDVWI